MQMVHYVLKTGRSAGQSRPAMVVRHWGPPANLLNLIVFLDGRNDLGAEGTAELDPRPGFVRSKGGAVTDNVSDYAPHTTWVTSVSPDESKAPGTWHLLPSAESTPEPAAAA